MRTTPEERALRPLRPLPNLIFASRWLQLPLYLGLIIAQAVYVWLFWQELYYLLLAAMGSGEALNHVLDAVSVEAGQAQRDRDHAGRARAYRRGDDFEPSYHGHRGRLRDIRLAPGARTSS